MPRPRRTNKRIAHLSNQSSGLSSVVFFFLCRAIVELLLWYHGIHSNSHKPRRALLRLKDTTTCIEMPFCKWSMDGDEKISAASRFLAFRSVILFEKYDHHKKSSLLSHVAFLHVSCHCLHCLYHRPQYVRTFLRILGLLKCSPVFVLFSLSTLEPFSTSFIATLLSVLPPTRDNLL